MSQPQKFGLAVLLVCGCILIQRVCFDSKDEDQSSSVDVAHQEVTSSPVADPTFETHRPSPANLAGWTMTSHARAMEPGDRRLEGRFDVDPSFRLKKRISIRHAIYREVQDDRTDQLEVRPRQVEDPRYDRYSFDREEAIRYRERSRLLEEQKERLEQQLDSCRRRPVAAAADGRRTVGTSQVQLPDFGPISPVPGNPTPLGFYQGPSSFTANRMANEQVQAPSVLASGGLPSFAPVAPIPGNPNPMGFTPPQRGFGSQEIQLVNPATGRRENFSVGNNIYGQIRLYRPGRPFFNAFGLMLPN